MFKRNVSLLKAVLVAVIFAYGVFSSTARAQSPQPAPAQNSGTAQQSTSYATPAATPTHYMPNRVPRREGLYYEMVWGIQNLSVKSVESGEIIRFSYHIVDPDRAKTLNDKKFEPALLDPQVGVKLVVPSLEKVGALRQSSTPIEGKTYWMAFSNKGRMVKRGDHVDIVIGQFHARNLVVE